MKREPHLPDIPTVSESGFPKFEVSQWFSLLAPAGTSSAIVGKLHDELSRFLADREVIKRMAALGIEPAASGTPAQFSVYLNSEMIKWAKVIKEAGFEAIEIGQHYLAEPYPFLQPTPTAARVAAEVPGMELRVMYLMPLNHPLELAETIATLDILTNGCLSVGVILGYRDVENRGFGFPANERYSRFMEGFTILKQLLAREEVTFKGKHYQIEGIRLTIPTVQQPPPPLLLGANVEAAVRRAARIGDGWIIATRATTITLESQVDVYREALRKAGKQPNIVMFRETFVADSKEKALEACRPFLGAKYESVAGWGHQNVLPASDNLAVPFEQLMQNRFLIGTPDDCMRQLEWYRDKLDVNCVSIRCIWPGMDFRKGLESIRRLGREVIPAMKG